MPKRVLIVLGCITLLLLGMYLSEVATQLVTRLYSTSQVSIHVDSNLYTTLLGIIDIGRVIYYIIILVVTIYLEVVV